MKLFAALLMLESTFALAGASIQDTAKLDGTWVLESVEIEGKQLPMDDLHGARLVVKGDKYSFSLADTRLEFQCKLDPALSPKSIDLQVAEGADLGKVYHGIYTLDKDTFKICRHTQPGHARPAVFGTQPDSGLMMVVWKREKS